MRFALLGVIAILSSSAALAHFGATGVVKERMDGMKIMADAAKALGAAKAGVIPFSPALARRAAADLKTSAAAARDQFPEGSLVHPSEASPAIWTDRARFDRILEDLIAAADALDAAAEDEAAARLAADAVSQTCKDCHGSFREKRL
ncbi:MAG: cytochrome c [Pseudomonadota bacterium]